jgi:hypothetical protein
MTLLYLLLAAVAVWFIYRTVTKSSSVRDPSPTQSHEFPTYETSDRVARDTSNLDKDEWEGSFWEVVQPIPAKARLRLNYVDGAGKKTERTVDVRQFGTFGNSTLLIGHCLLRDATRTFRTDRVQKCIDEETGEIVTGLATYLKKKYDESPERSRDALLEGEYDTLRILLYVGKADGQLRAAEKAIIRETCIAMANDSRLTDATIDELFANMAVPTIQAFKLAVGRLAKREQKSRTVVMSAAEKMIRTQKVVHQAEQEALDYMRKRLASPDAQATSAL